jgi:hypothetical protein
MPSIPPFMQVSVPNNLANQLYVYTEQDSMMKLVAPSGWVCRADYAADGSGDVSVYPSGETLPASPLSSSSKVEAIVGTQVGGCAGCAMSQACSLFNAAAIDYQSQFTKKCPARSPSAESVVHLGSSVVSFADPPGISGNENPSGGQYPANGVMTYHRLPVSRAGSIPALFQAVIGRSAPSPSIDSLTGMGQFSDAAGVHAHT